MGPEIYGKFTGKTFNRLFGSSGVPQLKRYVITYNPHTYCIEATVNSSSFGLIYVKTAYGLCYALLEQQIQGLWFRRHSSSGWQPPTLTKIGSTLG